MRLICFPGEPVDALRLGGKASALAALHGLAPIPPWFVLLPEAFELCLRRIVDSGCGAMDEAAWLDAVCKELALSEVIRREMEGALLRICQNGEPVAVRSSAEMEDSAELSFAGMFESVLCVRHGEVASAVMAVWRSAFGSRIDRYQVQGFNARSFRSGCSASLAKRAPAVLIQRMIDPDAAGVAFSADPATGRRGVAVVSGVFGLGSALVSGEAGADTWRVDRMGTIIERAIVKKELVWRGVAEGSGTRPVPLLEARSTCACLSDEQIRAVARLARQAETHFGCPQDIEWAFSQGDIYLLQSRPITSLDSLPDPDCPRQIWDNSNIMESYSGVTLPLTFSFARRAYEHVYRRFCQLMGVSRRKIMTHEATFRGMLGLIQGRVYYNLLNWYRLLALLPGFTSNRRFMEQMMGVKESLPDEIVNELNTSTTADRILDRLSLAASAVGLALNYVSLGRRKKRFLARLNQALAPCAVPLENMRADELIDHYRSLERSLLARWDAPLVNDFFAMIFFGVLRQLVVKWCGDSARTLQNDLICAGGGMISAEPVKRMGDLAEIAAADADLIDVLQSGSRVAIQEGLMQRPMFAAKCREYIEKFGDRCLEELKLESSTLHDDPLMFYRSVAALARGRKMEGEGDHDRGMFRRDSRVNVSLQRRREAESRVKTMLRRRPVRDLVFRWVLRNAREKIRDRENLRFERTRAFGRVRRIFRELGRRLCAAHLLDDPHDIFYLEIEEVLGVFNSTTTTLQLRELVCLRKREFDGYRRTEAPPNRFETIGLSNLDPVGANRSDRAKRSPVPSGDLRTGMGCSPGIVRGPVRLVQDPSNAPIEAGHILAAERTDPGWVLLFSSASGLLVERGSLLSHSAIVARELGLPAVVGIAGLTTWLKDGDWVELDGSTGVVRRIECEVP